MSSLFEFGVYSFSPFWQPAIKIVENQIKKSGSCIPTSYESIRSDLKKT